MILLLTSCTWLAGQVGAPADPNDSTEYVFTVEQGTTARGLGPALAEAGIVDNGDNFTLYVRLTKEGGCIKAGDFPLRRDMSADEILKTLCGVPLVEEEPFTIVEGWRIREIDAALAEKGWAQPGDYTAAASDPARFDSAFPLPTKNLEGYLYPETYMVTVDHFTIDGFIQRQIDTLSEKFYTPNQDAIANSNRTLDELVIMASMVEREEPTPSKRALVAGILWKRIDHEWNLGVDATSRYTLEVWNDRSAFLRQLRDESDPYNTRLRPGLPPTPIGNPGQAALEASLSPEESEYWYYLHDSNQVLHPSRNAREHENYRRQYNVY